MIALFQLPVTGYFFTPCTWLGDGYPGVAGYPGKLIVHDTKGGAAHSHAFVITVLEYGDTVVVKHLHVVLQDID